MEEVHSRPNMEEDTNFGDGVVPQRALLVGKLNPVWNDSADAGVLVRLDQGLTVVL
jgi:hypothetical protein